MTKQEILNGLLKITKEKYNACKAEIATVDKNRPTERGALQLRAGIYNVAIAAGLISGSDKAVEFMGKRFINLIKYFPDIAAYYNDLPEDQKEIMEIALYPEVFMRYNFYNTYNKDLVQAQQNGDPQNIFKANIKLQVLCDILNMWREFRVENDLFASVFEERRTENE